MANIIYDDKRYNEHIKDQFLDDNEFKIGTRKIYKRIFNISYQMESDLEKDLYDFSRDELRRLFYLFMASTPSSSRSNVHYVSNYLDWALEKDYASGTNILDSVSTEWKEQFVVRKEKEFLRDDEIREMVRKLINFQDKVILYAIFQGVLGERCSEITNLQQKDIDVNNRILHLRDDEGSTREIEVDSLCIELCLQALKEDEYVKKNGNTDIENRSDKSELISSNYIVRLSNTRVVNDVADENVVYRRFKTIATEFNLGSITPKMVQQSGMLAMAKYLLDDGLLNEDGYKKIMERFNVSNAVMQRLRNDFLNESVIREIYDLT